MARPPATRAKAPHRRAPLLAGATEREAFTAFLEGAAAAAAQDAEVSPVAAAQASLRQALVSDSSSGRQAPAASGLGPPDSGSSSSFGRAARQASTALAPVAEAPGGARPEAPPPSPRKSPPPPNPLALPAVNSEEATRQVLSLLMRPAPAQPRRQSALQPQASVSSGQPLPPPAAPVPPPQPPPQGAAAWAQHPAQPQPQGLVPIGVLHALLQHPAFAGVPPPDLGSYLAAAAGPQGPPGAAPPYGPYPGAPGAEGPAHMYPWPRGGWVQQAGPGGPLYCYAQPSAHHHERAAQLMQQPAAHSPGSAVASYLEQLSEYGGCVAAGGGGCACVRMCGHACVGSRGPAARRGLRASARARAVPAHPRRAA